MGAESVGAGMPIQVTLDDLAVMAAVDENHRYELSAEGVLYVAPPSDPDHALLVSRLFAWFVTNGFRPVVDCGIDVGGGRVPDLTVWADGLPPRPGRSSYAGTRGLLLAVEVVSRGSDVVARMGEYAKAGIPGYWYVERDSGSTVRRFALNTHLGEYEAVAGGPQPLAWLLATTPDV